MKAKIIAYIGSLSSEDRKKNIEKYFRRYSFNAHLAPALENSVNLMPVTRFYSKLKISVNVKEIPLASYSTKANARLSFT